LGSPDAGDDDDDAAPSPPGAIGATGNQRIRRFDDAKRELGRIYADGAHLVDLYCGCPFHPSPPHGLRVDLAACSYRPLHDRVRAERIEWEHAVPASAFGHTFPAWTEGDPRCVDRRGKRYRGRKCARIASAEFARMEADLHNLFPVVGEVNALRADLPAGAGPGPGQPSVTFPGCTSRIERGVFFPRTEVRGDVARAYKYMDRAYPGRRLLDDAQRAQMDRWDAEDPADAWEKERNRRIQERQGNRNELIPE